MGSSELLESLEDRIFEWLMDRYDQMTFFEGDLEAAMRHAGVSHVKQLPTAVRAEILRLRLEASEDQSPVEPDSKILLDTASKFGPDALAECIKVGLVQVSFLSNVAGRGNQTNQEVIDRFMADAEKKGWRRE